MTQTKHAKLSYDKSKSLQSTCTYSNIFFSISRAAKEYSSSPLESMNVQSINSVSFVQVDI